MYRSSNKGDVTLSQIVYLAIELILLCLISLAARKFLAFEERDVYFLAISLSLGLATLQTNIKYNVPHFGYFFNWLVIDLIVNGVLAWILVSNWF